VNETAELSIRILAVAAAVVLLVACANLAGLLLARSAAHRRETAVRLALGAGRWRVVRHAMSESLLLALAGGGLGVVVAQWGIRGLVALTPEALTRGSARLRYLELEGLGLDTGALAFALGLSAVTALVFGLAPAWRASGTNLVPALKGEAADLPRQGRFGLGRCLVATQLGLATVLVVGAGLMAATLLHLHRVETGVQETGDLLTFTYPAPDRPGAFLVPLRSGDADDDLTPFHTRFLTRLRSLPGVREASLGCPPLGGICAQTAVHQIGDGPPIPHEQRTVVIADAVEDSYFRTVGARILAGRGFSSEDRAGSPPVVVLNESAARALFPGQSPLGLRIATPLGPDSGPAEVIGVVQDILYETPDVGSLPAVYTSFRQTPIGEASAVLRLGGDPASLLPAIRHELLRLDPTLPIHRVSTVKALSAEATGTQRLILSLLGVFALAALALAAVGVYGSVAYSVSRRRREIAVRMALGARPSQVLTSILAWGLTTAAGGVCLGLAGSLAAVRVLSSLLYGVKAWDPSVHALAALGLLAMALLTSYLPARAASRVDPMSVLRAS
jgi:predicted permease